MYVIFCFVQHAKGKCLLRPGLGTLQSTVKNVPNRNKTPEKILGLEHPPAEHLVSDLPTVPTAHLILGQNCRYLYLNIQYSDIQTHTDNTNRYIRIHTYTYIYIQIHVHMHSVKTGLGGVFSCGQRPLMTSWPCSDQADQLGKVLTRYHQCITAHGRPVGDTLNPSWTPSTRVARGSAPNRV